MKKEYLIRGLRFFGGSVLILIGIVGIFLPILQGWLFIFLGLFLIKPEYAYRLRDKGLELKAKYLDPYLKKKL